MGVVVIPRVIFRLMASAFASASPDALMPLPLREAAAPFGQRQSLSLPHTLPGVWFVPFGPVPAAAGQAAPCPTGHSAFGGRCHLFEAEACAAGYRARWYSLALPRPLPRPSFFRLLRKLHRESLHSMFARLARWVHPPNVDVYNSTFPRSHFHGLGWPRSFDSLAPGSSRPFGSRRRGIYPGFSQGTVLPRHPRWPCPEGLCVAQASSCLPSLDAP
jgi:hypothetical protein